MTTRTARGAQAAAEPGTRRRGRASRGAAGEVADLLALPPMMRRPIVAALRERDLTVLLAAVDKATGSPLGLWTDDPVGFVEDVLGEALWSRQREILDALTTCQEVIVPAGFSVGKTWLASRALAHVTCTYPVGTALVVTIATRMRQVAKQLWPHVRRLHARAGLPGKVDTTQWKMPDVHGVPTDVAYGFSPPDTDEAAVQGIHASRRLLLIVDEAGGIAPVVGRSTRNLLTSNATMLAIGNPPTDAPDGWFEKRAAAGNDPERPHIRTFAIGAIDSPAVTGEKTLCRDCPPSMPEHPLADHLVDQTWIDEAIKDFGADHPYVQTKVYAKFPRGGASRIIPIDWLEEAADLPEPEEDSGWPRLCDLGLAEERATWRVEPGAWVRLGVDPAADGGDELAVARWVGDLATIEHTSSGPSNANAVEVAGKVLVQIRRAQAVAAALGSTAKVRVKVDAIGVGWGVASILTAWGREGMHGAQIVAVNVSENTSRVPDGTAMVPYRKRDEMWLAGRSLVTPNPAVGRPMARLRIGQKAMAQLASPTFTTMSNGQTKVESKKSMRKRGVSSPDQGESVLLGAYEPKTKARGLIV